MHAPWAAVAEPVPKRTGVLAHKAPVLAQHQESPPPGHAPRQHVRAVPVSTASSGNARVRTALFRALACCIDTPQSCSGYHTASPRFVDLWVLNA